MTSHSPQFDAAHPDADASLRAALAVTDDELVPCRGTGLTGFLYVPDMAVSSIGQFYRIVTSRNPDKTFIAGHKDGWGPAADPSDSASTQMGIAGPRGVALSGYLYVPPGVHEIRVVSGGGFAMNLGGEPFLGSEGAGAAGAAVRVTDFEGGLYEFDLVHFDTFGGNRLALELDGLPVDPGACFQSVEDFLKPAEDVLMIPASDFHPSYVRDEAEAEETASAPDPDAAKPMILSAEMRVDDQTDQQVSVEDWEPEFLARQEQAAASLPNRFVEGMMRFFGVIEEKETDEEAQARVSHSDAAAEDKSVAMS